MPGQITVVMDLNDSVTLDQYLEIKGFIGAALAQFTHLLNDVTLTSIPPTAIEVPLTVTVTGEASETVLQDVLGKVQGALKSTNGVQYSVQVAGEQAANLRRITTPVTEHVALTAPHLP